MFHDSLSPLMKLNFDNDFTGSQPLLYDQNRAIRTAAKGQNREAGNNTGKISLF